MPVSRCRFWWCTQCQAVFEKEDLAAKLVNLRAAELARLPGVRICADCGGSYQLRDIYSGLHDVPRPFWGQLTSPVELPASDRQNGGDSKRGPYSPGSPLSRAMGELLFLLSMASGAAVAGYVLVRPLFPE